MGGFSTSGLCAQRAQPALQPLDQGTRAGRWRVLVKAKRKLSKLLDTSSFLGTFSSDEPTRFGAKFPGGRVTAALALFA